MARLIDTRAASNKIHEYMEDFPRAETRLATCRVILSMLGDENQIPTIDPVHAAGACYCRECTCWNRHDDILPDSRFPDWGYCSKMLDSDSEIEITTLENDFCSWGQRREDTK